MEGAPWIRRGFVLAGVVNLAGMTVFTRGLTSTALEELAPTLFSRPSIVVIWLWGLAYIALSGSYAKAPAVAAVFALEKLFYGATWIAWLAGPRPALGTLWADDWLTGLFFSVYGPIDTAFGLFFGWVYLTYRKP